MLRPCRRAEHRRQPDFFSVRLRMAPEERLAGFFRDLDDLLNEVILARGAARSGSANARWCTGSRISLTVNS